MRKKITADIEKRTIELALEVMKNSTRYDCAFLIDDEEDIREFQCLLTACRKSVMDGFPLQDYMMGEIVLRTDEYLLIYFENKYEYGTGENYNPHAHEIIFECPTTKMIAVPYRHCNDGKGTYIKKCKNCFDAVYECGMFD